MIQDEHSATIIIVDDEDSNMFLFKKYFENRNIDNELEHLHNWQEAQVRLYDDSKPIPDILFIDINLKGSTLSGDEIAEKIRGDERFKYTRFIVMSAAPVSTEVEAKLAGCVAYEDQLYIKSGNFNDDMQSLERIIYRIESYKLRIIKKHKKAA